MAKQIDERVISLNWLDTARARRAQEAMMKMVKIDISDIERAANK
ncbi:hypothetical protein [Halomicronema hongdechloris]|nr:hypothetical protein [Halomicronema hongdechloris]